MESQNYSTSESLYTDTKTGSDRESVIGTPQLQNQAETPECIAYALLAFGSHLIFIWIASLHHPQGTTRPRPSIYIYVKSINSETYHTCGVSAVLLKIASLHAFISPSSISLNRVRVISVAGPSKPPFTTASHLMGLPNLAHGVGVALRWKMYQNMSYQMRK